MDECTCTSTQNIEAYIKTHLHFEQEQGDSAGLTLKDKLIYKDKCLLLRLCFDAISFAWILVMGDLALFKHSALLVWLP